MKGEINKFTIMVGDFNTALSVMERTSGQKINKDMQNLSTKLTSFIFIYYQTTTEKAYFSRVHGTFTKIGPFGGYKTNLNKYK